MFIVTRLLVAGGHLPLGPVGIQHECGKQVPIFKEQDKSKDNTSSVLMTYHFVPTIEPS